MKKEELNEVKIVNEVENVNDLEDILDVDADKAEEVLNFLFEAHNDLENLVYSLEVEWEDPKNKEIYGKILNIIKPMYEQIDNIKNNILDFI